MKRGGERMSVPHGASAPIGGGSEAIWGKPKIRLAPGIAARISRMPLLCFWSLPWISSTGQRNSYPTLLGLATTVAAPLLGKPLPDDLLFRLGRAP